jgi:N-acetyl sugar amidotransferase
MKNKIKLGKYGLPIKIFYCTHCTRSNQRPHNTGEFNQIKNENKSFVELNQKNGICNACKFYFEKQKINWEFREKELIKLCDKFRKNNGEFDVIVPGSGGKDSLYVAHQLKYKYRMNPLSVTWAPNMKTEDGIKNFEAWLDIGLPNYTFYQNPYVHRKLTRLAFLNLCHPFQPFIIGQKNFAPKIAVKFNINLVMFGEHDAEFGMMMNKKNNPKMDKSFFVSDKNYKDLYLSGIKVSELIKKHNFTLNDLESYLPLNSKTFKKSKIEFHFFSHYKKWNFHDNYYYAIKHSNFKPSSSRLEGSHDKYASMDDKLDWLHFYTFYIKFGMGRTTAATDQEIRSGIINRNEGIALIKRFDGEFPEKYLKDCLDYMKIKKKKFLEIIDKARPAHLWKKRLGKWILRQPIWESK